MTNPSEGKDSSTDAVAEVFGTRLPEPPSATQQSWGALISIVVIVLMVVVGAFYAWGKRIAEQPATIPVDDSLLEESNI